MRGQLTIWVHWVVHFLRVVDFCSYISEHLVKEYSKNKYRNKGENIIIKPIRLWTFNSPVFFHPKTEATVVLSHMKSNQYPSKELIHSWLCEGYKAALSVSVFHTMGNICCMEDTMGLGKFLTSAVTAWETKKETIILSLIRTTFSS